MRKGTRKVSGGCARYFIVEPLTKREDEIMEYICHGYSRRELSEMLGVEDITIATHLRNIYSKLCVSGVSRGATKILAMIVYLKLKGQLPENFWIRDMNIPMGGGYYDVQTRVGKGRTDL